MGLKGKRARPAAQKLTEPNKAGGYPLCLENHTGLPSWINHRNQAQKGFSLRAGVPYKFAAEYWRLWVTGGRMYDCKNQNNTALAGPARGPWTGIAKTARKGSIFGGAAVAMMLLSSPAALAETCSVLASPVGNLNTIVGFAGSVAGNATAAITTASTAFLLQSTAFVSAPGNPAPEQQGSGVWVRSVGGVVDVKSPSTSAVGFTVPSLPANNTFGQVNCNTQTHQTFVGVQFGHDVAKLNWDGWNVHFGTTAGYLEARNTTVGNNYVGGSFNSTVQTPFAGTYLTVTKGGFFADALLRVESYETAFNSPSLNIFNQSLNAHGVSFAASAGYNWTIPNTRWFIEPSAGIIVSRTSVDPFNTAGVPLPAGLPVQGVLQINDIKSTIGRAGVRTGTSFNLNNWVVSPFVAASVWHDFGDAPTANYNACSTCIVFFPAGAGVGASVPATLSSNFVGSTIGTFGQYSLGASAQLVNTGWVAFARVDYRKGDRLEGWDGTGGLRYHFTPEAGIPVIGKAPIMKAPAMMAAYNWTGFYIGGSAGAVFDYARMSFLSGDRTDSRGGGFIGGVQAGYNYQFAPSWVAGLEGGWDWTNVNSAKQCAPLFVPAGGGVTPLINTTCNSSADWVANAAARVGYLSGRALWYGKAGGAWAHESFSVTCNLNIATEGTCTSPTGGALVAASATTDRFGWLIGYGLEFAMTQKWTARAESTYMDFGHRNLTLNDGTVTNAGMRMITTKIGVNYKLN